jgi:hypothetical protein
MQLLASGSALRFSDSTCNSDMLYFRFAALDPGTIWGGFFIPCPGAYWLARSNHSPAPPAELNIAAADSRWVFGHIMRAGESERCSAPTLLQTRLRANVGSVDNVESARDNVDCARATGT